MKSNKLLLPLVVYNLEFNTYRLAMKLIHDYPDLEIDISSGKMRNREKRFIKLNDKKVSYDMEIRRFYCIDNQYYFNSNNDDLGMAEAIRYLTN